MAFKQVNEMYDFTDDGRINLDSPVCGHCQTKLSLRLDAHRKNIDCEAVTGRLFMYHLCRHSKGLTPKQKNKSYREKIPYKYIWRTFYSPRVVWAPTPTGVGDAVSYRLMASRFPTVEEDQATFASQEKEVQTNSYYRLILNSLRSRITSMFGTSTIEDEVVLEAANDSGHIKYQIRYEAARLIYRYIAFPMWQLLNGVNVSVIWTKFKLEWAKVNKFGRNILDLGTPASLYGPVANKVKKAMAIIDEGQPWRFVSSPDLAQLKAGFNFLYTATHRVNMMFYSDDSCVSIRCVDGIFRCNMDIAGADGSCGWGIFLAFIYITAGAGFADIALKCVKQCLNNFSMTNPYYRWQQTFRPTRPILYSGCVLTTIINNLANLLIFSALWVSWHEKLRVEDAGAWMIACALRAGFVVKVEGAALNDDMTTYQFLKMSVDSAGNPYLNLGVILRCIGSSDGDLMGNTKSKGLLRRMELADMRDFGIILGMQNAGDHFLLNALRRRFHVPHSYIAGEDRIGKTGKWLVDEHLQSNPTNINRVIIHDDILKRYNLSEVEVLELEGYIRDFGFGEVIDCAATRKIFAEDYGYVY